MLNLLYNIAKYSNFSLFIKRQPGYKYGNLSKVEAT
jgi:hypothetical protein